MRMILIKVSYTYIECDIVRGFNKQVKTFFVSVLKSNINNDRTTLHKKTFTNYQTKLFFLLIHYLHCIGPEVPSKSRAMPACHAKKKRAKQTRFFA